MAENSRNLLVVEGGKRAFTKDLGAPDPIPHDSIKKVERILTSGRLFRYACSDASESEVSLLEKEFAEYVGSKYAVAMSSCSSALFISLMCAGVKPGDKILMPAFTFTAVPSSIVNAGGVPVLVECQSDYCIDVADLRKKVTKETRTLLLSYMRGHIPDMDQIVKICDEHGIFLIEDCAHSLGASWRGVLTGRLGMIGCYSFQSYKVINAGEGGMLVSDDEEIIAKAILYSGSYENLWSRHFVETEYLPELQTRIPTYNVRMSNVTAAIVRPQIRLVLEKAHKYNEHYKALADRFSECEYIDVPKTDPRASIVPDSMQFNLQGLAEEEIRRFCELVNLEGIKISVFGIDENNARCFWNWKYLDYTAEQLPKTWKMLSSACDLRLPISLDMHDIQVIGDTILRVIDYVVSQRRHEGYWGHNIRSDSLRQPRAISLV